MKEVINLFTKLFWKDALERAVSTAAQAFVAVVGVGLFNVLAFDWTVALSVTAGAAVLAVAKALAATSLTSNTVSPASLVQPPQDS